jgi:DNA-binding response OmpR family regulator
METQAKPRVLLVDDEPIILRLLQVNMRLEGFEVIACSSGEEALRRASERPPDVVVLDVVLPGIDGFEVCERLREAPATARVPVIMVTAQAQDEDRERGYALGVREYVTKPFEPSDLVALVREAMAAASG